LVVPTDNRVLHIPFEANGLPDQWRWERLDDVCSGIVDCPHSTPVLMTDGPFIVRSQDIRSGVFRVDQAARVSEKTYSERIRTAEPRHGDLLYSREGTYFGIAAEIPTGVLVCLGQRMVLLRPDPGAVDFRFLRYWLNSPLMERHIHGYRDGTVAERLNLPTIRALPVAVPPLNQQRAITQVLGALDDKIELNGQMNETLEAMVLAIFKSWFVDFDPVCAKAAGQAPPGLDPEIAALFPNRFEQSELGEAPVGWRVVPLPEVIHVNPTRSLKRGELAPYLDMANMPTHSPRAISVYDREFGSGMRFIDGDTLLARITPCLENGKTCFVDFLGPDRLGWGSTEYIVLRPKPPLPIEYAYFLARTADFRAFAISNMTGTSGRQRVPADCFEHYLIVVPSDEVAKRFGEFARASLTKIKANDEESRTLATIRDVLLPKLLSGELRVPLT
jgi:type I restriction enzyme, S subunit